MHKKRHPETKQNDHFPKVDPATDRDGSKYRLGCFVSSGFFAYNGSKELVFFKVQMNCSADELQAFLKKHLKTIPFPTLMGEYDGHVTLDMFKAAEKEGLVTVKKAVI